MRPLNHQRELICRVFGIIKWIERYGPTPITVTEIYERADTSQRLNNNLQKNV
jgi:hypothetical protein